MDTRSVLSADQTQDMNIYGPSESTLALSQTSRDQRTKNVDRRYKIR